METLVNCVLKIQFFLLNLYRKILADVDLELQLFNVIEFCVPTEHCKLVKKILLFSYFKYLFDVFDVFDV